MSASPGALRRAAEILSEGWFDAYALGCRLYGTPPDTDTGRKSVSVRARRTVNRLRALGLIATRPGDPKRYGKRLGATHTLVAGGLEELPI